MPYIDISERDQLDPHINSLISKISDCDNFQDNLGKINYCVSRIISGVMGARSYSKIAMATGVLENIKQEFYRRIAESYEDMKIIQNGDIEEYKKF